MDSITITCVFTECNKLFIDLQISEGIKKYFNTTRFFCEYTFDITSVPDSILVVPLLANLLPFSWIMDCVIWVNDIDETFYENIHVVKDSFRELHPDIPMRGTLIAANRINNEYATSKRSIQLFTGGIDATASLINNIERKPILFNTNGWYKTKPEESNKVYDADYNAISRIGKSHNLNAEFVKSNFATFINASLINNKLLYKYHTSWWFGFQHSVAFIGTAFVAGYYYKISTIYIASSYTFGQYVVCVSDPRIDSSLKCSKMKVVHDGYELSRQDKVALITNFQKESKQSVELRVCSFNTHNCCTCEKCFRSMLALVAEGADDLSKFGFYLDAPLLDKLKHFIEHDAMELDHDHIVFWYDIISKMKDNYASIHYKEVYEYLSGVDLHKARKASIWNHYRKDFWSILKRKLHVK